MAGKSAEGERTPLKDFLSDIENDQNSKFNQIEFPINWNDKGGVKKATAQIQSHPDVKRFKGTTFTDREGKKYTFVTLGFEHDWEDAASLIVVAKDSKGNLVHLDIASIVEAMYWDKDEPREMDESSFSRQHYQAISAILKGSMDNEDNPASTRAIQSIGEKLAEFFKQDNPRFDEPKFLVAAGLEDSSAETHYKERG